MNKRIILAAVTVMLAGCATTGEKSATAEQRAKCQDMARTMGTNTPHDHGEMKGMTPNAMNQMHERCRQMMEKQG